MKNISLFLLVFVLAFSCSKEEPITPEPPTPDPDPIDVIIDDPDYILPTVSLISGSEEPYKGVLGGVTNGSLQYDVEADAPDGFISLDIFKVLDGVVTSYETIDKNHPNFAAGTNTQSYHLNYILNAGDVGKELAFKAVVTDVNNNSATLDFAAARVRLPMIPTTVTLQTGIPPNGDITIPYYLHIDGNNVKAVDHSTAVNVDTDQDIAMILSANDGSGFYLSSPATVLETVLVNGMQEKSGTKFKKAQINYAQYPLSGIYDIYDVYEVERVYELLNFGSHEEKAEQVSVVGTLVYFRTDDNRTGIFRVKDFQSSGADAFLTIELLLSR